jgi:hypothetical protein
VVRDHMKKIDSHISERGAVSVKTLLTFLSLGLLVFATVKIFPVYMEQRQVVYEVDEIANKAAVRNLKEEEVKKAIETLRVKYDLPEGSIKLESLGDNKASISLGYSKAIDLLVTTYNWKVDFKADGKSL